MKTIQFLIVHLCKYYLKTCHFINYYTDPKELPSFYVYGYLTCFATINFGGCVVFVERLPPSAQEIVQAIKTNKTTLLSASPLVLEQMISYLQETNDYSIADHLKLVLVGGAPLKPESGDWLLSHGINIRNGYGSTETGHVLISDFNQKSRNWNSLRPLLKDSQGVYYAMFETNDVSEPDVKHLYLRGGCPTLATHISNRLDGGYDTNDLFKEHPDYPGYYVYLCRRDDILVMENGEKTNPIPMEAMIRQSPVVKQVVVLGQGRRCTAALIQIDMQHALKLNPNQINASVHEAVKKANISCPKHSTVLPQMVWILPFNKTLPSTDKGTVMRKKAAAEYADVIEKLYKDFIEGTSHCATDISVDVSTWSIEGIESFLVDCASEVLQVPRSNFVNHSQSIFDLGFNSLSAIQLRNLIAKRFNYISQNFLFEYPTIASMQKALMSSLKEDPSAQIEKRYQQTQDLAHYYIKKAEIDFPVACKRYDGKKDIVVLLTGATGSLGSFMLRDMLRNTCVKKIYCCVRGSKEQLHQRLVEAFESRCLDVSLLNTSRIEALPMAFNEPFLGISKERYHQLKQEITVIQHSAWLLNFNLPIDHFDKECIAPFYNLLKFAYRETNPMHVHFISSVSANASLGSEIAEEPLPLNAHVAMPIGYSQSKFVVEVLLNYLTSEKNFPCYIERLGQVCGDSVNGVWNTSEQFPLMFIGGGSIMHKMPNLDITIDWIPVDAASVSIVNIMLRTAFLPADQDQFIYHIVNPCTVTWTSVLGAMRDSGMDFEIVSPSEWIESLLQDGTNPAYRLVSFYEASFKGFKMPIYKTIESSALSPLINQSPVLDATLFRKFLAYWKSVGFYA
jgi:thioester reductase-like protein